VLRSYRDKKVTSVSVRFRAPLQLAKKRYYQNFGYTFAASAWPCQHFLRRRALCSSFLSDTQEWFSQSIPLRCRYLGTEPQRFSRQIGRSAGYQQKPQLFLVRFVKPTRSTVTLPHQIKPSERTYGKKYPTRYIQPHFYPGPIWFGLENKSYSLKGILLIPHGTVGRGGWWCRWWGVLTAPLRWIVRAFETNVYKYWIQYAHIPNMSERRWFSQQYWSTVISRLLRLLPLSTIYLMMWAQRISRIKEVFGVKSGSLIHSWWRNSHK
jgi:hypothetical protein